MRESLNEIADLVERVEVGGVAVEDVSLSRTDGEELDVQLSVTVPSGSTGDEATAGDSDGETADGVADDSTASAAPSVPDVGPRAVRVGAALEGPLGAPADARSDGTQGDTPENAASGSSPDEPVSCRVAGCEETFETEHGMKIHATKAHRSSDGGAPSPHRDPERLREVYERWDTFEEMTAALDVDVTPQTVRRSMMSMGVHDPDEDVAGEAGDGPDQPGDGEEPADDGVEATPDGTEEPATTDPPAEEPQDGDADDQSGQVDAGRSPTHDGRAETDDGEPAPGPSGESAAPTGDDVAAVLPDEVDAEVFVTAVRDASTLFQVQRALGMEREEVQHLLAELGLLELVHGRVADEAERDLDREEIERRILEAASDDAGPSDLDPDEGSEPAEAD